MKKRVLSILMVLALLLIAVPMPWEVFAAGNTSDFLLDVEQVKEVPAEYTGIYNENDLKAIEKNPSGKYILMNDITLNGAFTPLCSGGFTGVLEGNGYTISGLSISAMVLQGKEYAIGLFAKLEGEICNLKVAGQIDIQMGPKDWLSKGSCFVGGFAGVAEKGAMLENCVADVDINVEQEIVGVFEFEGFAGFIGAHLAGGGYPSRIDFCRNLGDIKGNANTAGIIYEYSAGGTILSITYCVNEGEILGNYDVGGIMGRNHGEGYIIGCVNKGMVSAGYNVAGITAYNCPYMELRDCLNMGLIAANGNRGSAVGITDVNDFRRVERCINVGELRSGGQGAIASVNTGGIYDCYYLTGTLFDNEGGRYPATCTDTTGLLTEVQMADQSSFVNFDFESMWTMDNNLRHPYPTALMKDDQLKNLYKFQYIADHNDAVDSSMQYLEIMTGSGQGSMAGMISELYSNDKILAIGNQVWEGMNEFSDLLSWEVEIGNDYDWVLADLMSRMVSVDAYESMLNDEMLAALSDVITGLSSAVDLADVEVKAELEGLLKQASQIKDVYSDEYNDLLNQTKKVMDTRGVTLDHMSDFLGTADSILSIASATIDGCNDLGDVIEYYILCTAYAETNRSYAQALRDSAVKCKDFDHPLLSAAYSEAVERFAKHMEDAAQNNYNALFLATLKESGEMGIGIGGAVSEVYVDLCTNLYVIAAKAGFKLGITLSNVVTSMDDVSFYAKMFQMAGFAAEGMHDVVIERQVAFEQNASYENAEALSSAVEMYLTIQILACDYAIGYHEAIVSAALSDMFGGIEDELAAIIILQDERNMLYQFKEQGTDLYIGLDGTIGGFVSACPVTVLIETREGEEIARVETGKVSLAEGIFSHFDIMGTEGEKKTGFFDPDQHNLKILGTGKGTMDLVIYYGKDGELTNTFPFQDVAVEKNKTFSWNGESLIAEKSGSGAGLIITGVAVVAAAGLGFVFLQRKKKTK